MGNKNRTLRSVFIAFFCAIIILQNLIPFLGYIPLGPLDLTLIHITVIVAAFVLGVRAGALVGGVWGVITFIRAFVWPTSPLATIVFINPLVAIFPRIMIGVVAAVVFRLVLSKTNKAFAAMSLAAVLASLTNTFLVLGQIYFFYQGKSQILYHLDAQALLPYLLGVIGTNGIPEAILAGIIAPLISMPLIKKWDFQK
ncbi:ECF transporter S component [Liquorilactobacillus satsumensis]|uniref:ECF transporter S component n=1 Tax=Liquorilactobacillus satsumensis TaxID=259059 RepID=UPI0007050D77|nr:ECF transporter S component [Liquorilactobacillus satsumensis]MCC7667608.1 ECF transporter S component [Liquorilactobacillus satsumensis]MCP9313190.1 ECF transporter S component [Liquorilactobacillus satsumensis]MCP9329427.1 ECF transporter S component [Liquorilactobacillus satsumensis]MCP9357918.1 ECF transporter S component [Liquorilactobacillus satsumensis]MCP9360295.1 ECF transporter S component [Liquorilactobacillus satsumensis]